MTNNSSAHEDEINLIELIIKIWEGKWKILAIMIISIIFMIINNYLSSQKVVYFTASTDVQAISTFEENSYAIFDNKLSASLNNYNKVTRSNNVDLENYQLTKSNLFKVYIETLNDKRLFEEAIIKYNLLDVNKYSDEQEYNSGIINLASSVKIITNKLDNSAQIRIRYNDAGKWKKVLKYVDQQANKMIKQKLLNHFDMLLLFAQNRKDDELEDISIALDNLIIDYEFEIANKLIFLNEHSEMARKLGLEKNAIETQQNTIVVGSDFPRISLEGYVRSDTPYYLRGYEAIDQEIELIKARTNVNPFIPGLIELEKAKRAIHQDKSFERLKELFSTTPIFKDQFFSAASIDTLATKFTYKKNQQNKKIFLAAVFGLFLGIFYVFFLNALKSVKNSILK